MNCHGTHTFHIPSVAPPVDAVPGPDLPVAVGKTAQRRRGIEKEVEEIRVVSFKCDDNWFVGRKQSQQIGIHTYIP